MEEVEIANTLCCHPEYFLNTKIHLGIRRSKIPKKEAKSQKMYKLQKMANAKRTRSYFINPSSMSQKV